MKQHKWGLMKIYVRCELASFSRKAKIENPGKENVDEIHN